MSTSTYQPVWAVPEPVTDLDVAKRIDADAFESFERLLTWYTEQGRAWDEYTIRPDGVVTVRLHSRGLGIGRAQRITSHGARQQMQARRMVAAEEGR